ncbi:3'(2'),5'-bisphosphate nucleotidase [Chitinophaga costaii]|uniref:3'(2'),5'-bisphosphate nucleotidase CysQ n=1 Tax=Chitinophaga costaii TaxID=1335309 RepID=A0A1C4G5B7_9BACT|nr:3'(2'),5'-bisphosphate nucleotidase CysQ [Chitinophaga costaii]PUZ19697.1 3'(2'),5'-bisphosphate nucleotidase [Chitinophaga costaii]SCC63314.1 3'(2'),5'-bisphosphate nucleotidase [Chitinophaga costaii]
MHSNLLPLIFTIPGTAQTLELAPLLHMAQQAGQAILYIYRAPETMQVTLKEDQSPLTAADAASHASIIQALAAYTPGIPILSEEGSDVAYSVRQHWPLFWCVDPLDGTKEFIKRNGEFTVNIALIQGHTPILGLIYQPVGERLWIGGTGIGSFRWYPESNTAERLQVIKRSSPMVAVGSRTHSAPEETAVQAQYGVTEFMAAGSALKFCLVADGSAQLYYRHGPTMEWDTAAGQAIVTAAGGSLTTPDGQPFLYNKSNLRNGSFICKA